MGSTPGITNVMAGVLARGFDALEEAHVRVGSIDRTASGPLPVPYALDTVIDEFSLEPMVFRDGRPEAVPPCSGEEDIDFPAPVGRVRAFYTLHSEVAMFPRAFPGLRAASFKALPDRFPGERFRNVPLLTLAGGRGRLYLAFAADGPVVRVVRSDDAGGQWRAPVTVGSGFQPNLAVHRRRIAVAPSWPRPTAWRRWWPRWRAKTPRRTTRSP